MIKYITYALRETALTLNCHEQSLYPIFELLKDPSWCTPPLVYAIVRGEYDRVMVCTFLNVS